jgi:hypothetical protein
MKHSWAAGAALTAALAATGCSAVGGGGGAPAAVPMTLEQLAKTTGCTVSVQTNAAELRQGACKTTAGQYVVMTFPTDTTARTWFNEAKNWGGLYLIGSRWIIVGNEKQLETFRGQVGGVIQAGDDHSH